MTETNNVMDGKFEGDKFLVGKDEPTAGEKVEIEECYNCGATLTANGLPIRSAHPLPPQQGEKCEGCEGFGKLGEGYCARGIMCKEKPKSPSTWEGDVVSIIAESLNHGRLKRYGEDASHITQKMVSLIRTLLAEAERTAVRRALEGVQGEVYRVGNDISYSKNGAFIAIDNILDTKLKELDR